MDSSCSGFGRWRALDRPGVACWLLLGREDLEVMTQGCGFGVKISIGLGGSAGCGPKWNVNVESR